MDELFGHLKFENQVPKWIPTQARHPCRIYVVFRLACNPSSTLMMSSGCGADEWSSSPQCSSDISFVDDFLTFANDSLNRCYSDGLILQVYTLGRLMPHLSHVDENSLPNPRSAFGSVSASIMAASASEPARKAVPRQLDFTSAYGSPLTSSECPHRSSQPSM